MLLSFIDYSDKDLNPTLSELRIRTSYIRGFDKACVGSFHCRS